MSAAFCFFAFITLANVKFNANTITHIVQIGTANAPPDANVRFSMSNDSGGRLLVQVVVTIQQQYRRW